MSSAKRAVEELLKDTGIKINGPKSYDLQVHNEKFYSRILSGGSLALGESYMDGWWDSKDLDSFFYHVLVSDVDKKVSSKFVIPVIKANLLNLQSKKLSKKVAQIHYDIGNDFYKDMLDNYMQYTCGYWKNASDLNKAQENKLHLICKKLKLKKGETVLELGCGWGGFGKFAAKNYGVKVTGYNISKEQISFARIFNKDNSNEFRLKDYREASGVYDKVVSIGMCEHVGYKNYSEFFALANKCLKNNGLFLLHTIGSNVSKKTFDPWMDKYIFPGAQLPSISQLSTAMEGLFVMEDWHNIGPDYYDTLMAWDHNFRMNWHKYKIQFGERFYRMWRFYLMSSAGLFKSRKIQLWQTVLSKGNLPSYESVR